MVSFFRKFDKVYYLSMLSTFSCFTINGMVLQKSGSCNQTKLLYEAAERGDCIDVQFWLNGGIDKDKPYQGVTPLYIASQNGHRKVVGLLCSVKADVNKGWNDVTPLFIASQRGHAEVVKLLIGAWADVDRSLNRHNAILDGMSKWSYRSL